MDWLRLHIAINEAPAVGIGVGTALFFISAIAGGRGLQKTAFGLFVLTAVCAAVVFVSGGPAQRTLEHAPGVSQELVNQHWYAARVALFVSTVLGVIGIVGLRSMRNARALSRAFMVVCLLACAAAVASNGWAVYSGMRLQGAEVREQYLPHPAPLD
jgi:hypothetical protein